MPRLRHPRHKPLAALVQFAAGVADALEERALSAHKLLILTYLTDDVSERIASYLEEFLPQQVAHINGTTPKSERKRLLTAFRSSDRMRVLVGTIGTIGVGLTLFDPERPDTANEIVVADLPSPYVG